VLQVAVEEVKSAAHQIEGGEKNENTNTASSTALTDEKISWAREMLPYSGYVNRVSFFRTLSDPFKLLASPVVMWATLLFTTCISWLVGISITLSQIFGSPPYNFTIVEVGATNVSSFVAGLLGTLIAGPAIDGVAKLMSKKNKGIFGTCQTPPCTPPH
jgi:hypothetical protein